MPAGLRRDEAPSRRHKQMLLTNFFIQFMAALATRSAHHLASHDNPTDPTWVGYGELKASQYVSQATMTWFTDTVATAARERDVCVLNGYVCDLVVESSTRKLDFTRANLRTFHIGGSTRKVLLPILWRGHWGLLVWTRGSNHKAPHRSQLTLWDSLPRIFARRNVTELDRSVVTSIDEWGEAFLKFIRPFVDDTNEAGDRIFKTTVDLDDSSGVIQKPGSNDCAIFVWNRIMDETFGTQNVVHHFTRSQVRNEGPRFNPLEASFQMPDPDKPHDTLY